jgi:hypothetical protein
MRINSVSIFSKSSESYSDFFATYLLWNFCHSSLVPNTIKVGLNWRTYIKSHSPFIIFHSRTLRSKPRTLSSICLTTRISILNCIFIILNLFYCTSSPSTDTCWRYIRFHYITSLANNRIKLLQRSTFTNGESKELI